MAKNTSVKIELLEEYIDELSAYYIWEKHENEDLRARVKLLESILQSHDIDYPEMSFDLLFNEMKSTNQ
jgi:hypothetical protein